VFHFNDPIEQMYNNNKLDLRDSMWKAHVDLPISEMLKVYM